MRRSRRRPAVVKAGEAADMQLPLYQIDAFTSRLFGGNPAAVVTLDHWLEDDALQAIAAENNLAETAFVVPREDMALLRHWTRLPSSFLPREARSISCPAFLRHARVFPKIQSPARRIARWCPTGRRVLEKQDSPRSSYRFASGNSTASYGVTG